MEGEGGIGRERELVTSSQTCALILFVLYASASLSFSAGLEYVDGGICSRCGGRPT